VSLRTVDPAVACIYEGTVRHRRFAVRSATFEHRLALFYLDVERVGKVLGGRLVARSPGLVRFRREDYLGDPRRPLGESVRTLVEHQSGWRPGGAVRMLTHLRSCGHCFNPVSFYFCFGADDQLGAIVAEVTNTPWGQRHSYVLKHAEGSRVLRGRFAKRLHVSPFMGEGQCYNWRATAPGETLSVHIENNECGRCVFDATLSLRQRVLTAASLRSVTRRYPLATLRVLGLIYGHALALKLRGVPVYRNPTACSRTREPGLSR
jgi:DUF1365 family protein